MKKIALAAALVTLTLASAVSATAALTPDPLVVGDLDALTVLDALPEHATGPADTARDVFTAINERAGGFVPMLTLLRVENTIARGVLSLAPIEAPSVARTEAPRG